MCVFVLFVGFSLSRTIALILESSYRYFNPKTRYDNILVYYPPLSNLGVK